MSTCLSALLGIKCALVRLPSLGLLDWLQGSEIRAIDGTERALGANVVLGITGFFFVSKKKKKRFCSERSTDTGLKRSFSLLSLKLGHKGG